MNGLYWFIAGFFSGIVACSGSAYAFLALFSGFKRHKPPGNPPYSAPDERDGDDPLAGYRGD